LLSETLEKNHKCSEITRQYHSNINKLIRILTMLYKHHYAWGT